MDTDKKKKRVTYLLVAGTLCLAAWAASAMPGRHSLPSLPTVDLPPTNEKAPPKMVTIPKESPKVEVVFALDTTGSMGGLIDGAKRKIWSLAQFVASGQPKPEVRIGLVAYRDKGDEYVTKFYDLSDDLDQVFEHLNAFVAGGGGDTPEHVSKALHDAIYRTSWDKSQSTLKLVYLVGDAPPHTDYQDGYDYHAIARHAHDLGIHINTIRCGGDNETQVVWNQIAKAASGEYASIDQSGGVMVASTPYDDKLADLNSRLVGTAIGYGVGGAAMHRKAAASIALPAATQADRAGFFGLSGKGAVGGDGDLVNDVSIGRVAPEAVPAAELPAEMQAMDAPAKKDYVAKKLAERSRITDEIKALSRSRVEYLRKNAKSADSFDAKVEAAIKREGATAGLKY
jgi:Mg-chelatase subunit ChlD